MNLLLVLPAMVKQKDRPISLILGGNQAKRLKLLKFHAVEKATETTQISFPKKSSQFTDNN